MTSRPRAALVAPLIVSLAGIAVLSIGDLDARLVAPFYNEVGHRWPHRSEFLWQSILHDGGKLIVVAIALCGLCIAIASLFVARFRAQRRAAVFVFLGIAAPAALSSWIKHHSGVPCPWESTRFGGPWIHGPPYWPRVAGGEGGQCFPGAHASGGFSLMGLYFLLRDSRPRAALAALVGGYCVGLAFGAVQVVRGAHFPSHNFATAILVWLVLLGLQRVVLGCRRLSESDSSPSTLAVREGAVRGRE